MVNFNGQIIPSFSPPPRAAKYGDGFFETVRVFNGRLPFWKYHWFRMEQAFTVLKFNLPHQYTSAFFQNEISKLIDENGNHRIRLTIWRGGEGLYTPEINSPIFLIESSELSGNEFTINERGLRLGIYRENKLPLAKKSTQEKYFLQNIKTCNSLPFILANIYRQENNCDDILLLNTAGRIACGGSSNVFLWQKNKLATPLLSEGCVAGAMRSAVFDMCKKMKIDIVEMKIFQKDLKEAEGVFLTNSISGLRWVGSIDGVNSKYRNEEITSDLIQEINARINNY